MISYKVYLHLTIKTIILAFLIDVTIFSTVSSKDNCETIISSSPWILGQGIQFIPEYHDKRFNAELTIPEYYFIVWGLNHIPVYNVKQSNGVIYSTSQAFLFAGYYLNYYHGSNEIFDEFFINSYRALSLSSTYHLYRNAHLSSEENVYQVKPNLIPTRELFLSPFRWKNISHPLFYVPAGLMIGGFAVIGGVMENNPIWKHDDVNFGNNKMNKSMALLSTTGISIAQQTINSAGEEGFFRGVWYDIWKEKYGIVIAKLIDNSLFVGKHVPAMIKNKENTGAILGRCVYLLLMSNIFEYACDIDHFPVAIALHMWTNTFMNDLLPFIYYGGEKKEDLNDISNGKMTRTFSLSFTFNIY